MMRPLPSGLPEQFEVMVEAPGRLPLPDEVREAMGLKPGDLFSLKRVPISLRLESYREFLSDDWNAVDPENRWRYFQEFLRRPLTAVEPGGAVKIPPELCPLEPGERFILEVVRRGMCHPLYLYPAD